MSQIVSVDSNNRQKIAETKVEKAYIIETSDTNALLHPTIAIYVGNTGDIKLELSGGGVVTLKNIVAGAWHPISAIKVFSTDTTCTEIVGAY